MESNYLQRLKSKAEQSGNILCLGIDPFAEDIPLKGTLEKVITKFFLDIIKNSGGLIHTVKPNIAFFEQYGFEGLRALKEIVDECRKLDIVVIMDAKRGDIGKSSQAYAKAVFDFWKADAVTVNPYMGSDSVMPFIDYCDKGKGVYILVKTSNTGSEDLQDQIAGKEPLYMTTARKVTEWHKEGVGAVVGATYPKELEELTSFFKNSGKETPLLIPGVGSQGGDSSAVLKILRDAGDLSIHRINSSSGITYAYKKTGSDDYIGAAVKEIHRLSKELKI
jgi:orotidine-5'-phosphate decarboxylase